MILWCWSKHKDKNKSKNREKLNDNHIQNKISSTKLPKDRKTK